MRLRESGSRIVDYTWLHSRGVRHDARAIPDELTQVLERNVFLFNNPIVKPGVDLRDHRSPGSFEAMFASEGDKPFARTPIIDGLWLGNRVLQSYLDPARPLHCAAIYLNQGIAIDAAQTAWLAQTDDELPQDAILPVSRGLHATWLARDDLRESFDMQTTEGRRDALRWWLQAGSLDARYAGFVSLDACREVDPALPHDTPLPITRGMSALADARPDLRASIDLTTPAGRRALLAWWMLDGMLDPKLSCFLSAQCYVHTSNQLEQDAALPITCGLLALHEARSDLAAIDLTTRSGRQKLIAWWMDSGRLDPAVSDFMPESSYGAPDPGVIQDVPLPITRGLHALQTARPDFAPLDPATRAGRLQLLQWWLTIGRHDPSFVSLMPQDLYAEVDPDVTQDVGVPVTRGLHALQAARSDLAVLDLATHEGRQHLIRWWMTVGRHDPSFAAFMAHDVYAEVDPDVTQDVGVPVTRGLHALQAARSDLAVLDLSTREGRQHLILWWMMEGRHDPSFALFMPHDVYAEVDPDVTQDVGVPVTRSLHALSMRDDLAQFDLDTVEGRRGLVTWWMTEGSEAPTMADFMSPDAYMRVDHNVVQDAKLPITIGMRALHQSRDDLREAMDLGKHEGRRAFVRWWMQVALSDSHLVRLSNQEALVELAPGVVQDGLLPITRGLVALHDSREDLRDSLDLNSSIGRSQFIQWWFRFGIDEPFVACLLPAEAYRAVDPSVPQDVGITLTKAMCGLYRARIDDEAAEAFDPQNADHRRSVAQWWCREFVTGCLHPAFASTPETLGLDRHCDDGTLHPLAQALWEIRGDLHDAFDIETADGRSELNRWLHECGYKEIGLPSDLSGEHTPPVHVPETWHGTWRIGGANIVGFSRGELGIGEDVRMASLALQQADYDFCLPHIPLGIGARQDDLSFHLYEAQSPVYRTNLLFLPHYETIRLLAASRNALLGGRYNIGCWQWELPKYPKGMEFACELVDEVWSSTSYTADAMRGATEKPVFVMPMTVDLPTLSRSYARAEFGLPDDAFVFLNILDGNSSVARKNPLAVVRAFQKAFPQPSSGVHLLVKTMNMTGHSAEWDEVVRLAASDPRISILSGALQREQVIALQLLADCFVSLHRAEGFGRNIAEAMWLGKPVVVSAFSGNTDFTSDSTAWMVGGTTIPVRPGEYSFAEGQHWWDADVDEAAQRMRQVFEAPAQREARARAGQAFVRERYAPANVGRRYVERLRALDQSL
ncbi:glycosyltransferase [Paraburkholderia caffeinitolerans]